MRKNYKRRIAVDTRKKITTGYKGLSKNGKEIPKKADHFVLMHPETGEVFFPELIEFYGEKPKEMYVMFPSDDYSEFFDDNFNLWTSTHNKRRQCDGETCLHVIDEEVKGVKYKAGTESECICEKFGLRESEVKEEKAIACSCDMLLKAYILNPENSKIISPTCYMFYSGSVNTADNLRSQLERFKRLSGIPFKLFLKEITRGDKSFVIWDIIPYLTPSQLIKFQYSNVALTDGQNLLQLGNGETVHTEKKTEYNENNNDVTDVSFTEEKELSINEFKQKFLSGELEGEDAYKAVVKILEGSPTVDDLQMRGQIILEMKEISEQFREKIKKTGKKIKADKNW